MQLTPWEARALRRIEEQLCSESSHLNDLFARLQPAPPPPPRPRLPTPIPFHIAVMRVMVPFLMAAGLWLFLPNEPGTCTEPMGVPALPVASATIGSGPPAAAAAETCGQPGP
jgi:hypothetical protein